MKLLRISSLLFILLIVSSSQSFSFSDPSPIPGNDDPILQITDKYNEIQLGFTESKLYMIVSDAARELANQEFIIQFKRDSDSFADSNGSFLITENAPHLESNLIEYNLEDIDGLEFKNGSLKFSYRNKQTMGFEDILSYNGTKALENFYVEDLELFVITYNNRS